MNTKLLMTLSAMIMGSAGLILLFLPDEVSIYIGLTLSNSFLLQIPGALYFGFAMLNWMARSKLIGGIYSKPVCIGNFTHFMIGGIALIKLSIKNTGLTYIFIASIIYTVFAILFGYVFFTSPVMKHKAIQP